MARLTTNFDSSEFACPCCGRSEMDPMYMQKVQAFRNMIGVPFSPVKGGGFRCADYNGSQTGPHTEGKAMDPDLGREHYHKALKIAFQLGFKGVGVKQKDGKFQLHLDDADDIQGVRPRPWFWTY